MEWIHTENAILTIPLQKKKEKRRERESIVGYSGRVNWCLGSKINQFQFNNKKYFSVRTPVVVPLNAVRPLNFAWLLVVSEWLPIPSEWCPNGLRTRLNGLWNAPERPLNVVRIASERCQWSLSLVLMVSKWPSDRDRMAFVFCRMVSEWLSNCIRNISECYPTEWLLE